MAQKLFLFNNGSVGFDRKYQDLCTDEFLARIVAHDGYFRMIGVLATGVKTKYFETIKNINIIISLSDLFCKHKIFY